MAHRAAVLGKPVAHSLSPAIHNAGYAAAGLAGWSYTAIECAEAELPDLVGGLGLEWAGLSLTMPLKEAALAVARAVSPLATAIGAANTLVRQPDGAWHAENTDAGGMTDVLRGAKAGTVAVLGAGGTARAALAAVRDLGAGAVSVFARRAAAVDALRPVGAALGVEVSHVDWSRIAEATDADVVISTVPRGVAAPLVWRRPGTVLLDVVYDPWPTPLAGSAARAGCRVVSGLDLLVAQAVRQFVLFTGVDAPVEAMRTAALSPKMRVAD